MWKVVRIHPANVIAFLAVVNVVVEVGRWMPTHLTWEDVCIGLVVV